VAVGATATLLVGRGGADSAAAAGDPERRSHLAWIWQFDEDGSPEQIRSVLAQHGLGAIVKTHDGQTWMGKWDASPSAIHGVNEIRNVARFFEEGGVPCHAWCVVRGVDPMGEAQICDEVLSSGVRSLTFDLEPPEGTHYWQGGPGEALSFGSELRRRWPDAYLAVAPDPRPWQLDAVPIGEFASFSNEIMPQTYWNVFNSAANYRLLRERGYETPDGVTPELILDVTRNALGQYGKPIRPIGSGGADRDGWQRFIGHAQSLGMETVALWRYGTAGQELWSLLQEMAPPQPPPPPPPAVLESPPAIVEEPKRTLKSYTSSFNRSRDRQKNSKEQETKEPEKTTDEPRYRWPIKSSR
jgi:hypothetical protein